MAYAYICIVPRRMTTDSVSLCFFDVFLFLLSLSPELWGACGACRPGRRVLMENMGGVTPAQKAGGALPQSRTRSPMTRVSTQ